MKHCEHPNKHAPDPNLATVCCYCGQEFLYRRVPVRGHGDKVLWIYSVERVETEDVCTVRTS